jgi:hypothetical protein
MPEMRAKGHQVERMERLKRLHELQRNISQRRESAVSQSHPVTERRESAVAQSQNYAPYQAEVVRQSKPEVKAHAKPDASRRVSSTGHNSHRQDYRQKEYAAYKVEKDYEDVLYRMP